jgi:predicted metal-dependent hydrolase
LQTAGDPSDQKASTGTRITNDLVAAAMFNALSLMFPAGERFFIDSIQKFRSTAPPALAERIDWFSGQEGAHARVHQQLNNTLLQSGYDTARLSSRIGARLLAGRFLPKEMRAGITAAMEHFTAILAHELISDPKHLGGSSPNVRQIWLWHATEEIEHKSVAFDVFMWSTRALPPLRRYLLRTRLMVGATRIFVSSVTGSMIALLQQDGLSARQATLRSYWFLFLRPGIGRRVLWPYLLFYLPGFHPGGDR